MGKIKITRGNKKKTQSGQSSVYINRNQAIKKLQISLAQFRRLCILKGIYPREPKNKKKVNNGSTAPRTYYFRKDIQYLLHEPILAKLRERSAHEKKINRAFGKREFVVAKKLLQNRPGYTLDHVIKERFPTFGDALKDLDDALSLVFLYATLPADQKRVKQMHTDTCKRLAAEFQRYVVYKQCLQKSFLSIKGIYYQAEIYGQKITWIVPYQFSQNLPTDVDFRVMGTFLELYLTHLGFVNFKLYSDAGLSYPPKIDLEKDNGSAGLNSFLLETNEGKLFVDSLAESLKEESDSKPKATNVNNQDMEKRLKSLQAKLTQITANDAGAGAGDEQTSLSTNLRFENTTDSIDEDSNSRINDVTTLDELLASKESKKSQENIFSGCVFWLSREVPRWSLEFVIRSCGGTCGWDASSGAGSPFSEDSPKITHHVVDRPLTKKTKRHERREYIQPQWVYDCINAGALLSTAGYRQGEALPPHLSPFVSIEDGDYVPEEAYKLLKRQADDFGEEINEEEDEEEDEEEEVETKLEANPGKRKRDAKEEEAKPTKKQVKVNSLQAKEETAEPVKQTKEKQSKKRKAQTVEELAHQEELEAEAAGITFSEYKQKSGTKKKDVSEMKVEKVDEEAEMKKMAAMMLSKKKRKLYNAVVQWKDKKDDKAETLRAKKEALKKQSKQSTTTPTKPKAKK